MNDINKNTLVITSLFFLTNLLSNVGISVFSEYYDLRQAFFTTMISTLLTLIIVKTILNRF